MTAPESAANPSVTGPLQGLRILDLTSVVMGPYGTQMLADLGADVIKVESPAGDNMRPTGPMVEPLMGHIAIHLNRNKRSLVLDLKQPAGREACLRLATECDALIYNVRPAAMARLGLSYEDVAAVNPAIVYLGAFGYGETGPYAGQPAYDDLIQGAAGLGDLYARQTGDIPRFAPVTLADRSVGLQAALGLLAAVFHAKRTGQGQAVEITMFESLSHFVLGDHLNGRTFEPSTEGAGYARLIAPHRRPYATRDGHINALIYNDKHWRSFFQLIGRPELINDPGFCNQTARAARIGEVYAFVAEQIAHRTSAEWMTALRAADIPVSPMNTIDGLVDDPHLNAVGFFHTYDDPTMGTVRTMAPLGRYSATPLSIRRPAPRVGQDSAEVLREAGYSSDEIATLRALGVTKG